MCANSLFLAAPKKGDDQIYFGEPAPRDKVATAMHPSIEDCGVLQDRESPMEEFCHFDPALSDGDIAPSNFVISMHA